MSQYVPNREVDIGHEHAFTIIEFLDISHRPVFFIKNATFRGLNFVLVFR
jgi:hypothetical protein